MTYENNRRYATEAWIDNGEDEEFKKSFLKALLEEWQHHGNKFDADTVDGKHYATIKQEIEDATADCLKEFSIGMTEFNANKFLYYLGFEAIKLYDKDVESLDEKYKKLPWREAPYTAEEEIPNLLDVVNELYKRTYFGPADSSVDNSELYKAFRDYVIDDTDSMDMRLTAIESALAGKITSGLLNADSVNGLRFFIYTPAQYKELKDSAALYDRANDQDENIWNEETEAEKAALSEEQRAYKADYKKLNSIHNVFILKSEQEIKDSGYEDGIYPYNPDTAIINKYYQFKIFNDYSYYDEKTETNKIGKCLCYKHQDETEWKFLCPAEDFIDSNKVNQYTVDAITNSTNYVLNPIAVKAALIKILPDPEIPIVSHGMNNFIKGGYYNYQDGNNKTALPILKENNYNFLNLTPLQTTLSGAINQVQNNLDSYKIILEGNDGNGGKFGILNSGIKTVSDDLSATKGGSNSTISSLEAKINSLNDDCIRLQTKIDDLQTWETKYIWTNGLSEEGTYGYFEVNEELRLCNIAFSRIMMYKNSSGFVKGSYYGFNDDKPHYIPPIPPTLYDYLPSHALYLVTSDPRVSVALIGKDNQYIKDGRAGNIEYRMYDLDISKYENYDPDGRKFVAVSAKLLYHY